MPKIRKEEINSTEPENTNITEPENTMESTINVEILYEEGSFEPDKKTSGSSGFDVFSPFDFKLRPNFTMVVPLNFRVKIPQGYELQIRSRSGLAANHGVFVLNSPGTIDSDYRGVVGVILHNTHDQNTLQIKRGDRIAQFVLQKVPSMNLIRVEKFNDETKRGDGGFGSTGV